MASIIQSRDKSGNFIFVVRVSNGRGRQVTRTWRPEPGWSLKKSEWEASVFAARLEKDFRAGKIQTRREKIQEAAEQAQLQTVSQYAEVVYLPSLDITSAENTKLLYSNLLKLYLLPEIGSFRLSDITPAMLSAVLVKVASVKSHQTASLCATVLRGLFRLAAEDGSIPFSPAERVKPPRETKESRAKRANQKKDLTPEEVRAIFKALAAESAWARALVYLLADTGAREGEVCGLEWKNIDFKTGSILIAQNLLRSGHIGATKTGKPRTLDIGSETIAALKAWRAEQAESCFSSFVFARNGIPASTSAVAGYIRKLGNKAGISGLHCHQFRHTMVSNSIQYGIDARTVADRAGHSGVKMTLGVYAHSSPESIHRAGLANREALRQAIRGTNSEELEKKA